MSIILNVINYFWKIGFNENLPDIYTKIYHKDYKISINMIKEIIDYGSLIKITNPNLLKFSQRNFVIMESINRFLSKDYLPSTIQIGEVVNFDYSVKNAKFDFSLALKCKIWEDEYDEEIKILKSNPEFVESIFKTNLDINHFCIYTSRLKAGLIEFRYTVFTKVLLDKENKLDSRFYNFGLFEDQFNPYEPVYSNLDENQLTMSIGNFRIVNGILVEYSGTDKEIIIPHGVIGIQNAVFWYRSFIEEINIPDSVKSLGGDTFYSCSKLKKLSIPKNVEIIGDNPFSNCPQLDLINHSPFFQLEDGVLYNKEKTRLIYYSLNSNRKSFTIPNGVISIGKHAFYNSKNLEQLTIPPSVKIIENNPFSNCPNLKIVNNSPHFIFKDGALYNKTMSTLFYYELSNKRSSLEIPNGVKIIGRHSFFNCSNLHSLIIPESVKIIGYNPFTNCLNLVLKNSSRDYIYENGALYDKNKTELIYYSISNEKETFSIPKSITKIGRSAFYGSDHLKKIILPDNVKIIERSSFANCTSLEEVQISKNITKIGDWAFYNCQKLNKIILPKNIKIGNNVFMDCPINYSS